MASYMRTTFRVEFSDASTYSPLIGDFAPAAYEPGSGTYRWLIHDVKAATGGVTIDLGQFTTVTNILIKNKDSSNYVSATFRTPGGGSNDQVLKVLPGQLIATGTVTVANDLVLTANTAAVACYICIIGTIT